MQVVYDYDGDGYTVQLYDGDNVTDEFEGPVILQSIMVPLDSMRRWAIESALDFMESYDVDGDPVRDPTIRGGKMTPLEEVKELQQRIHRARWQLGSGIEFDEDEVIFRYEVLYGMLVIASNDIATLRQTMNTTEIEKQKNVIRIEIRGGALDVEGLPNGWDYELCDWDDCSACGGLDPNCEWCAYAKS